MKRSTRRRWCAMSWIGSGLNTSQALMAHQTATVAWIGDTSKPCVALRADIDALPIVEQTGLPYASTHPGRMHACGHDGHMSMLVGSAAVLKAIVDQLPVCVKFIWQPAEEGGGGANQLCKAGVLNGRIGPKVSAIFGLHGWPGLPVGCVSTRPGPLMAATDSFIVTFTGKGCHAAFPHIGPIPSWPRVKRSSIFAIRDAQSGPDGTCGGDDCDVPCRDRRERHPRPRKD